MNVHTDQIQREAHGGKRTTMNDYSRRSWQQQLRTVAPLVVMVLIVAACGSSEDEASTATTAPPPAPTTTTTAAPITTTTTSPTTTTTSAVVRDPAAVLAAYQDARNAGDIDALISLYAEDAVVTGHPRDDDGVAQGVDEIRLLERDVPLFQRSENATEYIDIQVFGTTVTFGQRFFNNSGQCFGGGGNKVTVQDGKITRYAWGPSNPCQ